MTIRFLALSLSLFIKPPTNSSPSLPFFATTFAGVRMYVSTGIRDCQYAFLRLWTFLSCSSYIAMKERRKTFSLFHCTFSFFEDCTIRDPARRKKFYFYTNNYDNDGKLGLFFVQRKPCRIRTLSFLLDLPQKIWNM